MKQSADNFSCVVQGVDNQVLVLQRDHVTNFVQEVGSKDAVLLVDHVPQRLHGPSPTADIHILSKHET